MEWQAMFRAVYGGAADACWQDVAGGGRMGQAFKQTSGVIEPIRVRCLCKGSRDGQSALLAAWQARCGGMWGRHAVLRVS